MEENEHTEVNSINLKYKRRIIGGIFLSILVGIGIVIGLYFAFKPSESDSPLSIQEKATPSQSSQLNNVIVDCHPQNLPTQSECIKRGCLWVDLHIKGAPQCIYPEGHGYDISGPAVNTDRGTTCNITARPSPNIYGGTVYKHLTVRVEYQTEHRLRVKIYPVSIKRYEVPSEALDIESPDTQPADNTRRYDVSFTSGLPQFGVIVKRRSNNATVFSTDVPGLTFTDQFLQITTRLPSSNLYGFGEHNHRRFQHDMNWKTWSMFTRDTAPIDATNLYGSQPVYMNLEDCGTASMVLLKNSNGMEVTLQPDPNPAVTYRLIGGILDFYIFVGDSPNEVVTSYIQAIGKPIMPPYWALGFHLCRWGYKDLDDMKMVMRRNREAGIPYDGQWADIDYMDHFQDFAYDKNKWAGLPEVINEIHDMHQKFVIITDAGISSNRTLIDNDKKSARGFDMFDNGVQQGVFINTSSGNVLIGKVWPGITAYPDFTNPITEDWWLKWMNFFHDNQSIEFDALWIDMDEPSNFVDGSLTECANNSLNYPPFKANILGTENDGKLFVKTICMDSQQYWGRHYDVHSLYGHSEAIQTHNALIRQFPGKRPWAMTRSNFVGTGKYASKWMGDNQSKWPHLHWSIVSIMEFSMFGFALNGADICGFWFEAEYEMCIRWHQLGAFYPFARNHNGRGDDPVIFKHQDPAAWDQRFIDIVKPVLMTRYRLLPYLYTLMFKAHYYGHMVMKALLFEFPLDKIARSIDHQFLLGPALLLSPMLEPNQTHVNAYFPRARWYDYHTGEEILETPTYRQLYTPLDKFNLHIRGGHVIPWHEPGNTTYDSRKNYFGISIALDENHLANGELFWDDGESLDTHENNKSSITKFTMKRAGELCIYSPIHYYPEFDLRTLRTIEIYGLDYIPQVVQIGKRRVKDEHIRQSGKIVQIVNQNGLLSYHTPQYIKWQEF